MTEDARPASSEGASAPDSSKTAPRCAGGRGDAGHTAMRRVLIYLAITFGITWALWIGCGLATGSYSSGISSSPIMITAAAVGMFVPLIGALLTNVLVGKENRIDLALRPRVKGNIGSYLLAWFVPTIITVAGAAVFFLVFPDLFDAGAGVFAAAAQPAVDAGQITADAVPALLAAQVAFAVLLAPFVNMIPAFGEEAGWRGMLFPSLCERFSQRASVLITGIIWGLWHAPITCMGHNYGLAYPGFPILGILSMIVFCTALGSCLAWLRLRVGSVWPCALAHGAINAISGIGIYFCTTGTMLLGPSPAGLVGGIPLIALGIWCWFSMRTRHCRC